MEKNYNIHEYIAYLKQKSGKVPNLKKCESK